MATYKEIQSEVKAQYGFVPKSCRIADVKERMGLQPRKAANRLGAERMVPCPPNRVEFIASVIRRLNR